MQTASWDAENHLATVSEPGVGATPAKSTSYLYDADGQLLIRRPTSGDGKSILYAGATKISVTKAGSVATVGGSRSYRLGGRTVAVRSKTGSAAARVSFLVGDQHQTMSLAMDSTTLAISKRFTDPFGASRGTGSTWVDDKAFLDRPADPQTGLTQLGARQYDPTIGRFLSVDPVLDSADGQSMNGYTYGDNSPVSTSDPSGLFAVDDQGAYNQSATNATGHAMTYASNVVHTPRAQARATSEAYHSMSNAYAKQRYERDQQDRRYGGPQYNPNSRTSVSSQNYYGNDNGNRAHVHGAPCNPLRLLFDWHSCQDVVSVSCGAEVAMVLPWFKVGKIGKLGIAAKRAHEAERAANAGARALPSALSGGAADTYVYFGARNGKNVYVGITNNLGRRQAEHGARFGLDPITSAPVTRGQARAIEQALIVRNPGFQNVRNSISPNHAYYDDAVSWGESWLKQNGL